MLKKSVILLLMLMFISVFYSEVKAQDGTIKIESSLLQKLIQSGGTHIMLKEINGSVYALDSNRNTIYPSGYVAPSDEVFYVFEVGYLKQLLGSSNKNLTMQGNTLLLQTDELPLCPPHCP